MPLNQGQVIAPTGLMTAGATPTAALGRSAEMLVAAVHGKYYSAVKTGRGFIAAQTNVTIPVNAATLASVFSLWNPMGSGVDVELIDADFWMVSATEVVNEIALYYQAGVGSAIAVPGTLTVANPVNLYAGRPPGLNQAQYYTALTHVGTPALLHPISNIQATAVGIYAGHYDFDGKLILPPGTVVSIAASTGAQAAGGASLKWLEWPV